MRKFKLGILFICLVLMVGLLVGCDIPDVSGSTADTNKTLAIGNNLAQTQPTPTDIEYSLERYNLIRRAYWVNGMRERAASLVCPVSKPLGYAVLFTASGAPVGRYVVDGKVSSLNSYLTPDSEWYEQEYWSDGDSYRGSNDWLPDVDGSYGVNDNGIFFFTPDGNYFEWTGTYLYTDVPVAIDDPVLKVDNAG